MHAELKLKLLLCCQFYSTQRLELLENLEKVERNFLGLSAKKQVLILLYDSQTDNSESLNRDSLKKVISYLKATTHFDKPLIGFLPMKIVLFPFLQDCFFFVNWISIYTWFNF